MGMHNRLRAMTIRNLGVGPKGKGATAILTKVTPGVFVPETSELIGPTEVEYVGSGLRVNYTTYEYRGVDILYGDFKLYLSPVLQNGADTPLPEIEDLIRFDGKTYKVKSLEAWNAAGVVCGWKIQVREG